MNAERREAVIRARAILAARGIPEPGLFRLCWNLGLNIRPPFFQSFITLSLVSGLCFALVIGLCWILLRRDLGHVWFDAAAAGVFFGLWSAGWIRWSARRHRLPSWDQIIRAEALEHQQPAQPAPSEPGA